MWFWCQMAKVLIKRTSTITTLVNICQASRLDFPRSNPTRLLRSSSKREAGCPLLSLIDLKYTSAWTVVSFSNTFMRLPTINYQLDCQKTHCRSRLRSWSIGFWEVRLFHNLSGGNAFFSYWQLLPAPTSTKVEGHPWGPRHIIIYCCIFLQYDHVITRCMPNWFIGRIWSSVSWASS